MRETFVEREFVPDITSAIQQQVALTAQVLVGLSQISQQLNALATLLGAKAAGGTTAGGTAESVTLPAPFVPTALTTVQAPPLRHQGTTIAIPPTPDALTSIVQAAGNVDYGTFNIVSFPSFVPAGTTYQLLITPPPNVIIQIKRKMVATCDTYSAEVQVMQFMVNGQNVLQEGLEYIIDSPKTFEGAVDLLVGQYGIFVEFYNPSSYDATVFIAAEALHLNSSFVRDFMQPALRYAYDEVQAIMGTNG
jgi:hypothetical protein